MLSRQDTHPLDGHDLRVDLVAEVTLLVEEVAEASGHAGSDVAADSTQNLHVQSRGKTLVQHWVPESTQQQEKEEEEMGTWVGSESNSKPFTDLDVLHCRALCKVPTVLRSRGCFGTQNLQVWRLQIMGCGVQCKRLSHQTTPKALLQKH